MLNVIEAFERLAYFGIRAVVPIYIMQATEPGGLHLTAVHKGIIYAWWAIFQSWLPMVTGGFADRFGYKKTLTFAISMNVLGYLLMAYLHSYAGLFAGILVLATGTAFFKPALQGSIAQSLHKDNASMGWGIFYWVVNIGGVCAPILATFVLGKPHSAEGWKLLFLCCAGYTALNLFILLTFRDVPSGADKTKGVIEVFWTTIENICYFWFKGGRVHPVRLVVGLLALAAGIVLLWIEPRAPIGRWQTAIAAALCVVGVHLPLWLKGGVFTWQLRLPAFILIMSCFWMMMYQLWDLHPNFIEDWIDSSGAARRVPLDSWWEYGDRGRIRVPQQILLSLNAALIVLLVVPISWLVRRMRTLSAMLIGMQVATVGILVAGLTSNGWILLLGILFFSLGEMLTGPKKNQYLGLIAPPGKKGLYLGYVNIPIGLGVSVGSVLAGVLYADCGEKATLALRSMGTDPAIVARAARSIDWSDSLELVPELAGIQRTDALSVAARDLGLAEPDAALRLRDAFRWDHGQIVNLALIWIARQDPDLPADRLLADLRAVVDKADLASRPGLARLDTVLNTASPDRSQLPLAPIVDLLPGIIGRSRAEAFDIVRDRMNRDRAPDAPLSDGQIVDQLWALLGDNPDVLDNLALEFLAQNTDQVADVVAAMHFADPVEELPARVGIDRTKSFAALACARGASQADVNAALSKLKVAAGDPDLRPAVYLAQLPHRRYNAVAKRDWSRHKPFLEALIASDPAAQAVVQTRLAMPEQIDYDKLPAHRDVIQAALAAKDWSLAPGQAAELLEINPYEARAQVAAELADAFLSTTHLLWDEYDPQYKVWIPFAAIGVLATIALAIFGQMAKKWADMNA